MPRLDGHTHAYPKTDRHLVVERVELLDGHLPPDSPNKWKLHLDGSIETLIEEEKKAGMDGLVLLPISGRPDGCSRLNQWVAEKAALFPQIIPFACLTPLSPTAEQDLSEALSLGLKGIKLHSVLQRIIPLQAQTLEWLEMIQASGLPLLMDAMNLKGIRERKPHMASILDFWTPFETNPKVIRVIARTFPNIRIIAAHLGCLYGWDQIENLFPLENVYFDLSFAQEILSPEEQKKIISRKGVDHILFGSDTPWRHPAEAWQRFLELRLSCGDEEKIGGGNLEELLKL
jgi:predicted TIM-barrel fold metal-dependent hydrolase